MTRDEIKKLSDDTFFDNNVGGITAESHRAFNQHLIEFIPDPVEIATDETPGKVKSSPGAGKVCVNADGTMSLNAYVAMATYVVDSNEALSNWARNVAGNNYEVVLIKNGTYNISSNINLSQAGTKVVIGVPGSKIKGAGLYYSNQPTSDDFYMIGVSIESSLGESRGFNNCINLYNCSAIVTGVSNSQSYCYYGCKNLHNCVGYGIIGNVTSATYSFVRAFVMCRNLYACKGKGVGKSYPGVTFQNCQHLIGCSAEGTAEETLAGYTGFSGCEYLIDCYAKLSSIQNTVGYENCSFLTNCDASVSTTVSNTSLHGCHFSNCKNLTNCHAINMKAPNNTVIRGYYYCYELTNCEANISVDYTSIGFARSFENSYDLHNCKGAAGGGNGVIFYGCRILFGCHKSLSATTESTFSSCYMNSTGTTNPVADTAAGGYNRSTK